MKDAEEKREKQGPEIGYDTAYARYSGALESIVESLLIDVEVYGLGVIDGQGMPTATLGDFARRDLEEKALEGHDPAEYGYLGAS
jgi:hypothetical protein